MLKFSEFQAIDNSEAIDRNTHLNMGRTTSAARLAIVVAAIPIIVLFCRSYVALEDPVYAFDFGAYWNSFKRFGVLMSTSPNWWRDALAEIWTYDYNPSGVIPLYPFYYFFGSSRTVYITGAAVLYLLPAAAVAATVAAWNTPRGSSAGWLAAFVLALVFLPFWVATLRGMIDIVGLIFLGLAILVMFRSDFLRQQPMRNAIALGFLLWAPFLFRRWYAFSIVSFFAVAFATGVILRYQSGDRTLRSYVRYAALLTLSGVILLVMIGLFQGDLALRILGTSYRESYAPYQVTARQHLQLFVYRFGWYVVALIAIGAVVSLLRRDVRVIFTTAVAILTFVGFASTQVLANHHFLPIAFLLLPAYFAGAATLSRFLVFLPASLRMLPACLIGIAIFAYGVTPNVPKVAGAAWFLPSFLARPLTMENFDQYKLLTEDLTARVGRGTFAVYASNLVLADEIIRAIKPELTVKMEATPHLASRDLFNFSMLTADYAVVPSPPQTHMAPGTQANITIPGEMILAGQGFGAAYRQVAGPYNLANGVKAYLLKRERPITASEVADLIDRLVAAYPNWKTVFSRSAGPIFAAMAVQRGDQWGNVRATKSGTVFIHPGATTPSSVTLPFSVGASGARLSSLILSMDRKILEKCPQADGVTYTLISDNALVKEGAIKPGEEVRVPLPSSGRELTLSVDMAVNPVCDSLAAAFAF